MHLLGFGILWLRQGKESSLKRKTRGIDRYRLTQAPYCSYCCCYTLFCIELRHQNDNPEKNKIKNRTKKSCPFLRYSAIWIVPSSIACSQLAIHISEDGPTAILLRDCPPSNGSRYQEGFHDSHLTASPPEFLCITLRARPLGEIIPPSPSVPLLPDFSTWLSGAPSTSLFSQALHIQFF